MKRPRIKYGKGTTKGTLKVRSKCGVPTVKVVRNKYVRTKRVLNIKYCTKTFFGTY